jgi:hypothetical protein
LERQAEEAGRGMSSGHRVVNSFILTGVGRCPVTGIIRVSHSQ